VPNSFQAKTATTRDFGLHGHCPRKIYNHGARRLRGLRVLSRLGSLPGDQVAKSPEP
jgi:hypothetical protein